MGLKFAKVEVQYWIESPQNKGSLEVSGAVPKLFWGGILTEVIENRN